MINQYEIMETIRMIEEEKLDIRTITMGISLLDCAASSMGTLCERIYDKICKRAASLVRTGESIEDEYGIPLSLIHISIHRGRK